MTSGRKGSRLFNRFDAVLGFSADSEIGFKVQRGAEQSSHFTGVVDDQDTNGVPLGGTRRRHGFGDRDDGFSQAGGALVSPRRPK